MERLIGSYMGEIKGPLFFVFGGMHGNEWAGIEAIESIFEMLLREKMAYPKFTFKGKIVGIAGNIKALRENKRFIKKDLNREWALDNAYYVKEMPYNMLSPEQQEMKDILACIEEEIAAYQPQQLYFLDLHTTTAKGGIFSIVSEDPKSTELALQLHAPVIAGMLKGIQGTTLHFFNEKFFKIPTVTLSFESGQHTEKRSVARAVAAIVSFLRATGMVRPEDVEHKHDEILITYGKDLPTLTQMAYVYSIGEQENFKMKPGYRNFQAVKKGEHLASNEKQKIYAPMDGLILMPLYQNQGNDGFFIVKEIIP